MATETDPTPPDASPGRRGRRRWVFVGLGVVVVVVVAVLALGVFEVQTLFTDDKVDEAGPTFESGAVLDEPSGTGDDRIGANSGEGLTVDKVSSGQFVSREHKSKGTAVILTDGRQTFVRFEDDFSTSNGPELWAVVYVDGARVELDELKGNEGAQNYELPRGIDPDAVDVVAVWCKRFDATFTDAKMH